jgi:hypothetical protein
VGGTQFLGNTDGLLTLTWEDFTDLPIEGNTLAW